MTTDLPIPAPASWSLDHAAEDMDDMAEFAVEHQAELAKLPWFFKEQAV